MKISRIVFLTLLSLLTLSQVKAEAYQNPVFGNWEPTKSLLPFWEGIKPGWWDAPGRKPLVDYCQSYAASHKPFPLLDDIVADQKKNPEETRTFVYSWVVTAWAAKTPGVLAHLKKIRSQGDPEEKTIASDFIAEIESASKGEQ